MIAVTKVCSVEAALSWDFRPAADALALLDPVQDRFSEGFRTADMKSANPP
jgi:hypothetical protein